MELSAAHLLGVAIMRHVVGAEPVASASVDELVAWVGPQVDRYLQAPD